MVNLFGVTVVTQRSRHREAGQAITEYIMMLAVIMGIIVGIIRPAIQRMDLNNRLTASLNKGYAKTYQYGDPRVRGPEDDQGPDRHPRYQRGNNFRIFINPRPVD